jgi:hypothetical protein
MRRVDHQQRKAVFQKLVQRLPKDARRLHGHVRAARCRQPIGEHQQIARHGAEGADLLAGFARRSGHQQTRDDRPLVDIEAATALVEDLHGPASCAKWRDGAMARWRENQRACPTRSDTGVRAPRGPSAGCGRAVVRATDDGACRTRGADSPTGSGHRLNPALTAGSRAPLTAYPGSRAFSCRGGAPTGGMSGSPENHQEVAVKASRVTTKPRRSKR